MTNQLAAASSGPQLRFTYELLATHFRELPPELIATSRRLFPARMRPDLQRALDRSYLPRASKLVGIHTDRHEELEFSALLERGQQAHSIAPVQHEDVDIGEDAPVACLTNALALLDIEGMPAAVLVAAHVDYMAQARSVHVEIAVPVGMGGSEAMRDLFARLEEAVRQAQSYRGKVLSLEVRNRYAGTASGIAVHKLHAVDRDQVILPRATLALLDRNVIEFARLRDRLREAGMSTKKGLLFYGPPGTGKTHTVHYLANCLPGHTTLLVTAEQVGLLPEYFQLARLLQPSILVIEDADLVARDRQSMHGGCEEVLLNQLLNEMDGLREEADAFFILTTNRPETLEAALAARPGRIDQAIEFPRPDAESRDKLLRLYAGAMALPDDLRSILVARTAGVSAAFIKELMRRLAQFSLASETPISPTSAHVDSALEEMLFAGGRLNTRLLGGTETPPG